jgi:hypothetical protein
MEKKISYVDALTSAIEVIEDADVKEKLEALKASLVKKQGAKSKKVTEAQGAIDEAVLAVLGSEPLSPTNIFVKDAEKFGSVPKVTASLGRLVKSGKVKKDADKALYSLAE